VNGARWALLGLVNAGSVAAFGELLAALPFPEGYALVFGASFVAGLVNMWVYARLEVPEQEPPQERHRSPAAALRALLGPLAEGGLFRRYLALNGLARLGIYLPVGLFSIFWVRDLAISDALVGLRTTVGSLALTLGYYLWGRLASRLGHGRVLVLAAAGLACYPLLTAVTTRETLGLLLVAALVWGAFAGGVEVALFELLVLAAAGERRLRFFAVNIALTNLVALGGPVVGAALAETWGIPAALLVAAGALLLCAGLAAWWRAALT
jgi:predicted MFS family arabinose efflux permease